MFNAELSDKARHYLSGFGVIVRTNESVVKIESNKVTTQNDTILTDTIIWAAGNEAGGILKSLNTTLDKQGRVIVNNDCSINDFPNVFVIGDASSFKKKIKHYQA